MFRHALLVEDEQNLASSLMIALKKLGIEARHVSTLHEARGILSSEAVQFILLDRRLPDGDGMELCRELRQSGYRGMVLMLTASGSTEDRIEGLESGADDYLPKPFSWEELTARIRALARRGPAETPESAALWARDPERLRILGNHGWVELTPLEFKLAAHLMDADGAIISRDELLKEVWGFSFLTRTRTVDHFVGRLRKHFELNPEEPRHFLTIRGAGYRFQK